MDGTGLSMVERLTLEEALLNNTQDNWILVGRHVVWPPKHIAIRHERTTSETMMTVPKKQRQKILDKSLPGYIKGERPNPNGMIVMGIGGKAEKLLTSQNVIDDQLLVVKRFSGGGTVVMDENAIWTTLIAGRRGTKNNHQTSEDELLADGLCKPYPRDIMKWTAEAIFAPTFDRLNADQNNPHNSKNNHRNLPIFSLQEDDYVLTLGDHTNGETRKMGGNAQAIKGKQGWLHHTSFLWDYEDANMERYLKLPENRPDYRTDRSHREFLVKLKEHYGSSGEGPSVFIEAMKNACGESLGILETDWPSVFEEVFDGSDTAMNVSWHENRTRIQHEL